MFAPFAPVKTPRMFEQRRGRWGRLAAGTEGLPGSDRPATAWFPGKGTADSETGRCLSAQGLPLVPLKSIPRLRKRTREPCCFPSKERPLDPALLARGPVRKTLRLQHARGMGHAAHGQEPGRSVS